MSWADLLLVLLGFAVGAYGTIVGAGGGFLLVPALLILYPGYSQQEITSISLFVVLATAVSGSIAYARRRLIDYRTALIFAAVSIPAGFAGAFAVRLLPRSAFDVTFGVLLIVLATYLSLTLARGERPAVREPVAPGRFIVAAADGAGGRRGIELCVRRTAGGGVRGGDGLRRDAVRRGRRDHPGAADDDADARAARYRRRDVAVRADLRRDVGDGRSRERGASRRDGA